MSLTSWQYKKMVPFIVSILILSLVMPAFTATITRTGSVFTGLKSYNWV
jgi:hypothetical protein